MDRIERLMANRESLPDSRLTVSYEAGSARVELGGDRSQTVRIERDGDGYVFTSVVLGTARAAEHRQDLPALANRRWQRNRQTDVVNFTFDRHNRLIGRIEHPANQWDSHNEASAAVGSALRDAWNEFRLRPDSFGGYERQSLDKLLGRPVGSANSPPGQ